MENSDKENSLNPQTNYSNVSGSSTKPTDSNMIALSFSQEMRILDEKRSQFPQERGSPNANTTRIETEDDNEKVHNYNLKAVEAFKGNFIGKAQTLLLKAVKIVSQDPTSDQSQYGMVKNNIGCILLRKGEYDKGHQYLSEAYSFSVRQLGNQTLTTLVCLNNLLCLYLLTEEMYKINEEENIGLFDVVLGGVSQEDILADSVLYCCLYENYGHICGILSRFKQASSYMQKSQAAYEKALEIKQKTLPDANHPSIAKTIGDIGSLFYEQFLYEKALQYFERAFNMRKEFYKDAVNLDIADSLALISKYHRALAKSEIAIKYEKEILEIKQKVMSDSPNEYNLFLAQSFQTLGEIYYDYHDDKTALEYSKQALTIIENSVGKRSLKIAELYENIGLIKLSQNEFQEAYNSFQTSREIYKKAYGKTHYKKALIMGFLGKYHKQLGNYSLCQKSLEKKSKIIQAIFSDNDPYMAIVHEDIATAMNNQGLYAKSLESHRKAFQIRTDFFGENSQFIADTLINIGIVKYNMKEFNHAADCYDQALKIYQEQLCKHNKVATALDYLAECFSEKGNFESAYEYYFKALEMRKEVYGEDHLRMSESYRAIGSFYTEKEEHNTAIMYHQKALSIYEKHLGKDHSEIASAYSDIGSAYCGLGMFDKALTYYTKALKMREKIYGPKNLSVAYCYYFMGITHHESSEFYSAILNYDKALKLYQSLLGERHSHIADLHEVMGNAYYSQLNFAKAMENYQKTLEIRQSLFNEDNIIIAASLYNIGRVHRRNQEFESAVDFYTRSLTIYKKNLGEEHAKVAGVYEAIANSYESEGRYPKALEFYNLSLGMRERLLGKDHRLVAQSSYNLGLLFFSMKDYHSCLKEFNKALRVYQRIFGPMHAMVSTIHESVARVYSALHDFKAAVYHYKIVYVIAKKIAGSNKNTTQVRVKRILDSMMEKTDRYSTEE